MLDNSTKNFLHEKLRNKRIKVDNMLYGVQSRREEKIDQEIYIKKQYMMVRYNNNNGKTGSGTKIVIYKTDYRTYLKKYFQ